MRLSRNAFPAGTVYGVERSRSNPQSLLISYSADRGSTWTQSVLPRTLISGAPRAGVSVYFLSPSLGWASVTTGSGGGPVSASTVARTTDGGRRWTTVGRVHAGPLTFSTPSVGWAAGGNPSGDGLYTTSDGGAGWSQVPLPVPAGYVASGAEVTRPPTFFGSQDGVLPVVFGPGLNTADSNTADSNQPYDLVVDHTSDGGSTWTQSSTPFSSTEARPGVLGSVAVINPTTWMATDGTRMAVTTDGGATWRTFAPDVSLTTLQSLVFVSPTDGYALLVDSPACGKKSLSTTTTAGCPTAKSNLFETMDGGHDWQAVRVP